VVEKTEDTNLQKLEELYEKLYGEKFDEAHNAAADVNATAQVFFEMMRIGIIPAENLKITEAELQDFISNHKSPIQPFAIVIRRQVAASKKKKQSILVIAMKLKSAIISTSIITVFIRRFKPLRIFMN
jgi:hypothetical protein